MREARDIKTIADYVTAATTRRSFINMNFVTPNTTFLPKLMHAHSLTRRLCGFFVISPLSDPPPPTVSREKSHSRQREKKQRPTTKFYTNGHFEPTVKLVRVDGWIKQPLGCIDNHCSDHGHILRGLRSGIFPWIPQWIYYWLQDREEETMFCKFWKWSEDPQKRRKKHHSSGLQRPLRKEFFFAVSSWARRPLTFDSKLLDPWPLRRHQTQRVEKLGVKTDHPLQIETLFHLAWKCSRRLSLVMFGTHWYKKHRLEGSVVWVQMNKRVDFLRNEGNISS